MSELEKFYEEYVEKVYKFFYIQSLDVSTAEDLTSQTFIICLEKFDSEIADKKKYLYAVMRNTWANFLRKKYQESVSYIEQIDDFYSYSQSLVQEYEGTSLAERAQKYIERLPEKQRVIARMRLLEEKTVKEVAEELKKTRLYVKTTQHRAVINLKKMIGDLDRGGVIE